MVIGMLTAARLSSGEHVIWKFHATSGGGLGAALVRAFLARVDGDGRDIVLKHYAFHARAAAFYERLGLPR